MVLLRFAMCVGLFLAASCVSTDEAPVSCTDMTDSTALYLSGPRTTVNGVCAPCHQNNKSTMRLYPGNDSYNMQMLLDRSRYEVEGIPLPLVKMTGKENHGGGQVTQSGSDIYESFRVWIQAARHPQDALAQCQDTGQPAVWNRLILLSESQTVYRAYQEIVGTVPNAQLMDDLAAGQKTARQALVDLFAQPSTMDWIKEIEDADNLHTRKYWHNGVDVISGDRYKNKSFWNASSYSEAEKKKWAACAQNAVGQEVVNTIAEVVRLGRPYTDLACTSIAVNPCSARVYGMDLSVFKDVSNMKEFVFMNPPDVPQGGGLLASNMFATRWPTTPTNRSRNRSKYWWGRMLDVDVLARGTRPVDVTAIGAFNPVMNSSACTVCHSDVDPVAQLFLQSWNVSGASQSVTEETWKADMFPPGIGQNYALPYEERHRALAWAGDLICSDPDLQTQFRMGAIKRYFTALTGTKVAARPTDTNDPFFESLTRGVKQQEVFFETLRTQMEQNNDDVRQVVAEILLSPWYRSIGVTGEVNQQEEAELSALSSACVKNPYALDRMIRSLGFSWIDGNGTSYLGSSSRYLFYSGGADSDQVLTPLCDTNGFRALIEDRVGHAFACQVVGQDFALPAKTRTYFPLVEADDVPTYKGEVVPGIVERIQNNLQHLAGLFYHRTFSTEEVSQWTDFAVSVQKACLASVQDKSWSENIPHACQAKKDPKTGKEFADSITKDPLCALTMWRAIIDVMVTDPSITTDIRQ